MELIMQIIAHLMFQKNISILYKRSVNSHGLSCHSIWLFLMIRACEELVKEKNHPVCPGCY